MKLDDETIQTLRDPGYYPIEKSTEVVVFKSDRGTTQAALPAAKKNLSRVIRGVRGIVGSSPTIVHAFVTTGDDRILVRADTPSGVDLVASIDLPVDGDQVTLLGIEPGVWAASRK